VKPVEIMEFCLRDVPKDVGPVLDPFLGSGTTLLACIETGHDGIGIEREEEYAKIADARIRHRDYESAGWNRAEFTSPFNEEATSAKAESEAEPVSLDDFFGVG
jgi:DNA modification methylase